MENQAEIKTISFTQSWRIFVIEAFLFSLTLVLGIATAFKTKETPEAQEIPQFSFWQFIFYFLLTTLFFLFLTHFTKFKKERGLIFKFIFISAVSLGSLLFLEVWLPTLISLIFIISLVFWWLKSPSVLNQNILMVCGMVGVGSSLGLGFQPEAIVFILIIFSIYDFIAVYKTKHMVKMAKEMMGQKSILALVIPQNISGFKASLEEAKPGGNFLILGGGDIIFPLLFSVSLIPSGISNSIIVAIFSLIGLFASFYIFTKQKIRQPIPALPPIALFSIIGYLITRFI